MFLQTCSGAFVRVWSGYTPKRYDGHFLEEHKNEIEADFQRAVIIGDAHFGWGMNNIRDPQFITSTPQNRDVHEDDEGHQKIEVTDMGTAKGRKRNTQIHAVRERVEKPFADLKNKWLILAKPWQESLSQLDCTMYIACGAHNISTNA